MVKNENRDMTPDNKYSFRFELLLGEHVLLSDPLISIVTFSHIESISDPALPPPHPPTPTELNGTTLKF